MRCISKKLFFHEFSVIMHKNRHSGFYSWCALFDEYALKSEPNLFNHLAECGVIRKGIETRPMCGLNIQDLHF